MERVLGLEVGGGLNIPWEAGLWGLAMPPVVPRKRSGWSITSWVRDGGGSPHGGSGEGKLTEVVREENRGGVSLLQRSPTTLLGSDLCLLFTIHLSCGRQMFLNRKEADG